MFYDPLQYPGALGPKGACNLTRIIVIKCIFLIHFKGKYNTCLTHVKTGKNETHPDWHFYFFRKETLHVDT